eukprot:1689644-Karenia_brevis.AAC.1
MLRLKTQCWASWGRLVANLDPTWRQNGAKLEHLRGMLDHLGRIWRHVGGVLQQSWKQSLRMF